MLLPVVALIRRGAATALAIGRGTPGCSSAGATAGNRDSLLAQPVAHILRCRQVIHPEEHLANVAEQGLLLALWKAFLELAEGLVVKLKPYPVSPVLIHRVI